MPGDRRILATSGTQSFTASLANTSDTNVTWEVNGIPGGNASVGTISSTGVYSAPGSVPPGGMVTVSAVAAADNAASASAQLTINAAAGSGGGGGALDWLLLGGAAARLPSDTRARAVERQLENTERARTMRACSN